MNNCSCDMCSLARIQCSALAASRKSHSIERVWSTDGSDKAAAVEELEGKKEVAANGVPTEQAMLQLEHCAKTLRELQRAHRKVTLSSVAGGAVSADDAIARVDTLRRLEAITRHAWRSAEHLADGRA